MRYVILTWIVITVLLVGTCDSWGEEINLAMKYKVADYNKSANFEYDGLMCWAYALMNLLQSTSEELLDVNSYFEAMRAKFGNKPITLNEAMQFVYYEADRALELMEAKQAGEVFSFIWDLDSVKDKDRLMWIKGALLQNEMVLVGIRYPDKAGHVVTCYGYKYENGKRYLGIADSDDEITGIFWREVTLVGDKWTMEGFELGYLDKAYSMRVLY